MRLLRGLGLQTRVCGGSQGVGDLVCLETADAERQGALGREQQEHLSEDLFGVLRQLRPERKAEVPGRVCLEVRGDVRAREPDFERVRAGVYVVRVVLALHSASQLVRAACVSRAYPLWR